MKTFFSCLALAFAFASSAQAAVKLQDKGSAKNFLYENDPKALASEVDLVFRSGSLGDPKGQEGLSHLAFSSLLRGTKTKSKEEFFGELERLGASIELNVAAGRILITLHSVSDNLEKAIELLADTIVNAGLKDDEIEAVKEEELGHLNQELTQNRRLMKRIFRQAIFQGTPLAFPPEGTISGMKALSPTLVRAYLAERLKAGSAVFAVSSNKSESQVRSWIEKSFAGLPEGAASPLPKVEPKALSGRIVYVMDRKGSSTSEVGLGHVGINASRKDREALETGLFAFGEDLSSRVFKELREKKGWTYGAYAGFTLFDHPRAYGGGFMLWAFPQAEFTEPLVLRAIELYESYAKDGLTKEELSHAQKSLANSYPFKFDTSRTRLNNRLYQFLEGAPARSVPEYRKIVNSVTLASLKQSIHKVHDANNLAIVLVGDPSRTEGLLKKIPNIKQVVRVTDPMQEF